MKLTAFNVLTALAIASALNLQFSNAFAQATAYSIRKVPNPTPAENDFFGSSATAIGTDRVLIGASWGDAGQTNAGAAYLFNTDGALLATFTDPTPTPYGYFGIHGAAVGNDRVLIGSYDGAYLFSTNAALLTTFTNPMPATTGWGDDLFGSSLAVVGTDRVLIGAPSEDTGADDAGAVYLFTTNGTLLTTFTNPTPAAGDNFGSSVAAVGTDRVLIGASLIQGGASVGGVAYLFSTNGLLLMTFTDPTPAASGLFGMSVASVGTDHVLVGAPYDSTGATDTGAAYLITLIPPSLTIRLTTTNTVTVHWPSPSAGWTLQENTNGVSSVNWSNASGPFQDDGTNKTLIVNPPTGTRLYRLFNP